MFIAHKTALLLDHQELQGEKFSCCEEGFCQDHLLKVIQLQDHQCRAGSGTCSEAKTFGGWPGQTRRAAKKPLLSEKNSLILCKWS